MSKPPPKPRVWTYRDLREASASALAAYTALSVLSFGAGLAASPLLTASVLILLGAAALSSRTLRAWKDQDVPLAELAERGHLALVLSFAAGTVLLLAALLMIRLSGWSAWLALALPLAASVVIRAAFLLSDRDYRILAGLSLATLATTLAFPGWGPRGTVLAGTLLALAVVLSGELWNRLRHGILKGKIVWPELLRQAAFPAAAAAGPLLLLFLAASPFRPAWNPAKHRPPKEAFRLVIRWQEEGSGGKPPKNGANGGPTTSNPSGAPPAKEIVVTAPRAGNLKALAGAAAGIVRGRGPWILGGVLVGCPLAYGLWRIWRRRKGKGSTAEEVLSKFLETVQRRRSVTGAAPPPIPDDPRLAVVFLYNAVRQALERNGYKRQPHLSPREYERFLSFRLSEESERIGRITDRFERALYGPGYVAEGWRSQMQRDCESLQRRVEGLRRVEA